MAHVVPDLPSSKASQALFSTYYLALVDDYDPVKSGMTAFETAEMDAALALVPRASVTKLFAVDSGNWNTAGNWYPSGVPGAGTEVCIPEGCVCTYDLSAAATELNWLRVDGTLKTDTTVNTAMLFDTMVVTPLGTLRDGTRSHRVDSTKTHQWIIATSNGLIDVSVDTFFQSRGIISIGTTDMWGAYKTPFLEVTSYTGPTAGATSLTLASEPTNWAVGDEIIIGATRAGGLTYTPGPNVQSEVDPRNERKTLTSVSGAVLGWTGGLTYNHAGPTGTTSRTDCKCFVANITRNIVVKPDDTAVPANQRGHTMQMHNPAGWSARDVEFADLGRTVKLGGWKGMVRNSTTGVAISTPVPLTASSYWDGSKLTLGGPAFLIKMYTGVGTAGNVEVVGTDEVGGAQSETLALGADSYTFTTKYYQTVTSVTFDIAWAQSIQLVGIDGRSRQLNENGVRDRHTDSSHASDTYTTVKNTTNIQGRYPFHWHKMGASGTILTAPPVLDNCSFHGSPGWLVAQHQTHGDIKNCIAYDADGAGFVAEDGNETGLWSNNIAFHMIGNGDTTHKVAYDEYNSDPARSGVGFWFTGRMLRVENLYAVGCAGGHVYNSRLINVSPDTSLIDQPSSARGQDAIDGRATPIAHFVDCQAIACQNGFVVVRSSPVQRSDLRTPIVRYKAWSTMVGMEITYTQHYLILDPDLFGGFSDTYYGSVVGLTHSPANSSDQVYVNPVIEGFTTGIDLEHSHTAFAGGGFATNALNGRYIVNPTFRNNSANYDDFDSNIDYELTTGDLTATTPALSGLAFGSSLVTGAKATPLGSLPYPFGADSNSMTYAQMLTYYGYWVNTPDSKKYVMSDEWFSNPVTGELFKVKFPIDVTAQALGSYTNNGSCNLALTTPPTFNDFTVSMTRNTNLIVDIAGRASGSTPRFGGFTRPMKTYLKDNGDGTITLVPLKDENYTETCHIWVDDVNGNTTRATMTINVNKRALYLGRQDLL